MKQHQLIRRWLVFFILALVISGATAIPAESELAFATRLIPMGTLIGDWLDKVYMAVVYQNRHYPYLAYGYDWLAFAHFVLAVLFIGPLRDPVRNKWVIEFGMIACVLVIPFALIAGAMRGLPLWWRLVDCAFGVAGLVPLIIVWKKINLLELTNETETDED
ncbi:MAG: hypothetical protein J0M10_08475 [Chitinophagales bacterium]|nr:hypothetical protein [Chitinophagales bacterium]